MNKELNFKPVFNHILITSHLVKMNTTLSLGKSYQPTVKSIQQIVAIGPRVEQDGFFKVGDWVVIDLDRYKKHVKVQSRIKAGIGGEEMIEEKLVLPFFELPGIDDVFLKISDREIEGIIPDFKSLPKDVQEYMTTKEFTESQEKLNKE